MADDNTQNQQDSAPLPDWLKKARDLAQDEGKGQPEGMGGAGAPSGSSAGAVGVSGTSQTAVQSDIAAKEEKPAGPAPAEAADAPLPDWLKKAADKAVKPADSDAAPVPVNPEEHAAAPAAGKDEMRKTVETAGPEGKTGGNLPGWLQKIQRDGKEAATGASNAEPASPSGISVAGLKSDSAVPVAVADSMSPAPVKPADTAATPAAQKAGAFVPAGMIETGSSPKPEASLMAEKKAPVEALADLDKPGLAASAAVTEKREQLKEPAAADAKPKTEILPAAKNKTDIFKAAESAFLSFLGKGAAEVKKGQSAGAPGAKTSSSEKSAPKESVAAVTVQTGAIVPAGAAPSAGKTPEKGPVKPSEDKVTAEERKQTVEAEKIYQQGIATIRDLIAPSSMEISYDKIRIEGMYAQSFYVYTYPRYLDTNWLSPVINFDVTMDISQFIYPIDSSTIMRVLKKKVAQMQASVRINAEKGLVSDPALETALQDAEELRTQIQRGQEKFFQFALYFTIYSEDDKKLTKIAKQLESILGGKLILTKKTELQMEHGFNSCIPMCTDELEVNLNMNTSPLSSTFPFSSSDLTSNEGILYGLNRHNDSLIIFDRFSLENANSVVFAKSGAGKSYCVKLEILRSMMIGSDVIVIDPENEYEALAQTVGGSYLRVSLTSDRRINPFDLPSPMEGEDVQPGDLLRQNIISLHGLMKIMLGGITPEEEGIMDKALNDVYSVKGITMDMVDPGSVPAPTMEDLYDILSAMEGGQSLAQRLQKFTVGTYSGIFNKPTNVDLESGLMVFCIRDLEDALRPIAMYIILNYIWNRIRSKLKKRLLVIDEAWTMMQHDDSARFLFGLVKRARKYYLGITTITQDVEDFVKSPYGKPVVTNSSMQLLLKQAPSAVDVLAKTFNLTEGEKYMLLNSGVGQGLFFAGLKHVAIQIIASYTEDKIVTTNPEEILKGRESAQTYESA